MIVCIQCNIQVFLEFRIENMEKKELEDKLQSKAMELAIENKDAELEAALKRIEELQREILLFQGTVDRLMKENAQKDEINKDLRYRVTF